MNNKKKRGLTQASKPVRSRKKVVENISHIEKRRKLARERKSKLQSLQTPPSETESVSLDSIERIQGTNKKSIEGDALTVSRKLGEATIESARIDKTNLTVKYGYISKDDSHVFKEYLGGHICDKKNRRHRKENLHLYSLTSNLPQNYSTNIRKTTLELGSKKYSKPLFTGKRQHGSGLKQALLWKLNVNPTSIIYNVSETLPHTEEELREKIMGRSLLSYETSLPSLALDGKENIIPSGLVDSEYQILENQIYSAIYKGFDEEVTRVAEINSIMGNDVHVGFDKAVFNDVEVYWEVEVDKDAHGLFDRLLKHLSSYSKRYRERGHGFDLNSKDNARSACVYLNDYERIVIYIKSDTRIRFEVRFDLTKDAPWLKLRRTCKSIKRTNRLLTQAKEQALERIHHLSEYLTKSVGQKSSKEIANDTNFIWKWFAQIGNGSDSLMLLNILRSKGCLVKDKSILSKGKSVSRIFDLAKRKKLLVYQGAKFKGGTYHPNLPCKKTFTSKLTRLYRDHKRDV